MKELLSTRDQLQVCAYLAYFLDGRETSLATSMGSMSKLARQIAADAGKLASAMDNLEGIDILCEQGLFCDPYLHGSVS